MQVKGSAIVTINKFIKDKFGEEKFQEWLKSLTPEARDVYQTGVLPSTWYELKTFYTEPLIKIVEVLYGGDINGAWDSGRLSADYALGGIYAIFVKLGSPTFIIKKAKTIITTYYTPCELTMPEMSDTNAILRITQFPEITNYAEKRIGGWMERAIEISGGKNVKVKITKSLAAGDIFTEYQINWQ
jgi:hypothetical protein